MADPPTPPVGMESNPDTTSTSQLSPALGIPPSRSPVTSPPGSQAGVLVTSEADSTITPAASVGGGPIVDVGWDDDPQHVSSLMPGITNEEVWLLLRRMDMSLFHIKDSRRVPAGGLDLVVAPEQEFSPNKMRSQLERLYMSVIVSSMGFVKHVSRLRCWNERTRTALFCITYFVLWLLDHLTFGISAFMLTLILSPSFRTIAFPSAPIAMVGTLSGDLTKPNAGILGSKDSITGAPENMKGEAVENEASNFAAALAAIAVNIMSGKDPQGEPNPPEQGINGPMEAGPDELATMVASGKDKAEGVDRPSQDKSKAPMETIMWSKVRPAMHALTTISNIVEQFSNALNPQPPFDSTKHRLQLAGAVIPVVALSPFVTRDLFFRFTNLAAGILLFGGPLLAKASAWLDAQRSGWSSSVKITNSLLYGIPTDAQLALTLLRHGERKKTPFPPPPRIHSVPPKTPLRLDSDVLAATGTDHPLGASKHQLAEAAATDNSKLDDAGGDDVEATKQEGSKEPHKALQIIKSLVKAGVKGAVKADKTRARLGNEGAKRRTGVVPGKKQDLVTEPHEFDARYEGQKGYLYIHTVANVPKLSFNKESAKEHARSAADSADLRHSWSVSIDEIKELRKHSGYGFKTKLVAGWALDQELSDSLGITTKDGEEWAVTAVPRRDALFNRLIAIGGQNWEIW